MGHAESATTRPPRTPRPDNGVAKNGTQASIVEPRPLNAESGGEDIFLSPRVMDAGAFARYSEMLKSIIAQATAQGRTLEDFTTDADALIKRCSDAGETINKRLQAGIRMLKMIDERAERTDLLLDRVQESLPDSAALGQRIDALVEDRLGASQRRLDEMVSAAEARAQAAEQRAREAAALSQEHAGRLEALASAVDARLAALDERIESARAVGAETGEELRRQGSEAREQLDRSLTEVLGKAHEAGEGLSNQIDEALTQSERRVAELDKSIEPVLEASTRAMRALGMDPENPVFEDSPLARIEQLVDRGETQLASLDRVYRQLEDLQSQAESVRSAFGNWLLEAAGELDKLESRKDAVVGPMSQAAKLIKELGPDVENKLELASTKLSHLQSEQQVLRTTIQASSDLAQDVRERMSNQSGQLQALLDGSLHKLSTRVEQAGVWLGALIQRAESLGSAIPGAGTMQFEQPVASGPQPEAQRERRAEPQPPVAAEPSPTATATPERAPTPKAETVAPADADPTGHGTPTEHMRSFTVPRPPRLAIDALSFDGSDRVIEHQRDEGDDRAKKQG